MLERERLIEIAASVTGVGIMVATLYYIGATHTEAVNGHRELSATGGELVVYSIVAFVFLMAIVGAVLIRTVTIVEDENGDDATGT